MKKLSATAIALSAIMASSAFANTPLVTENTAAMKNTVQTKQVIGFDGDNDPIYGAVNGVVKTKQVLGFDNDSDPIYGATNKTVKTKTVIGFDNDGDPIYK